MSKEEVVCGYGDCSSKYRNPSSLRTHQRKKHAKEYAATGYKMRNSKRARIDELLDNEEVVPMVPTAQGLPMVPAPSPELREYLELTEIALANTRRDFERQIEELNQRIESQQRQMHMELSGLMTEVIDQREHLKRLSMKSVKWCVVCFENEVEYAFQPCGHKCVCKDCALQTLQRFRRCPCCRSNSSNVIRIFEISAACEESH